MIRPAETNPTSPDIFPMEPFSRRLHPDIYSLGKLEEWENPSLSDVDLGENLKSEKMLFERGDLEWVNPSNPCPKGLGMNWLTLQLPCHTPRS